MVNAGTGSQIDITTATPKIAPVKPTAPTRWLKLSSLVPGQNPRGTDFEVDDLIESFEKTPLLHNIVVRRIGTGDKYEIIAGHRRVEAAKQKGWASVEAKIVEVADTTAELMMLEENIRRKALPDEVGALARLVAPVRRVPRAKSSATSSSSARWPPGTTAASRCSAPPPLRSARGSRSRSTTLDAPQPATADHHSVIDLASFGFRAQHCDGLPSSSARRFIVPSATRRATSAGLQTPAAVGGPSRRSSLRGKS